MVKETYLSNTLENITTQIWNLMMQVLVPYRSHETCFYQVLFNIGPGTLYTVDNTNGSNIPYHEYVSRFTLAITNINTRWTGPQPI
jgi:hypothetical protein